MYGAFWVWTCLLLFAVFKLFLVADREIVGAFRPHDDYWHIQAAAQWVWGRPFDPMTLVQLPVYALYVAISGATGLPLRISIEIVYLLSVALATTSLGRLGLPRISQIVVFGMLVFHPFLYEGLDFALPETLYTCLTLAFAGLFIRILVPKGRSDHFVSTVLFALVTALLWYMRKESILVEGLIGLIAFGIALAWLRKFIGPAQAIVLGGRLVAAPLVTVVLFGFFISGANGLKYGLWSTDQLGAPNYRRMFSDLLSISPERPIHFVSVTRASREQAYAVSPSFRELQPFLDGSREHWTARITRTLGIGGGEIGAGWFYWALIDTTAAAGHFSTPSEAEAFYGRIADELETAFRKESLPHRLALLPYVDPSLSVWLPYWPESILRLAKELFPFQPPRYPERLESNDPVVIATYDHVAKRRVVHEGAQDFQAKGWALSSNSRPLKIGIIGRDGETIPSRFEPVERRDVKPLSDSEGHSGPNSLGFQLTWAMDRSELNSFRMKIALENGESATSEPIGTIPLGTGVSLSSEPASQVFLALDQFDKPKVSRRSAIADKLNSLYPALFLLFAGVALIKMILGLRRDRFSWGLQEVVLLFVIAIISSRILFFAVLDASAWSAEQTRYLLPAVVLLPIISAVMMTLGQPSSKAKISRYSLGP